MADTPSTSGVLGASIKLISLTEARTRMEDCDIILCGGRQARKSMRGMELWRASKRRGSYLMPCTEILMINL
jgi:hypothetical protein